MTQDEIIRMAREAGIGRTNTGMEFIEKLERFAALVAEATKEKAAKVCEKKLQGFDNNVSDIYDMAIKDCAAAIRSMK